MRTLHIKQRCCFTCWVSGQRNSCCPVGIILYPFKSPLSACEISLEVNDTVQSLVCTTSMIGRDSALSIAAACFPDAFCKRLIRLSFPEVPSVSDDAPTHACIESMHLSHSDQTVFSSYGITLRKTHVA